MQLPLVVGGVALVVLLISTANVSNLLMLRVTARRRELAVRHALGAGRWNIGRLLVMESVVLAALCGAAALALAAVAGRVLRDTLLPRYEWADQPLDVTAVAFTGASVVAVALVAALFPAVFAARSRGIERLDGLRGARALGGPVRSGLIVVQAALSLVLLDGAAIFYRSFEAARQLDIGYAKENLLTVWLGRGRDSPLLDESAVDSLEAHVRSLPGVLNVAQGTNTPLGYVEAMGGLRADGTDRLPRMNDPFVNLVTSNYFRVAGQGIHDGRGFTQWDRAGTQKVAVVNTTFARIVWPGKDAVGRCLFVGREATDCTTVVGVAESPLEFGLQETDRIPHYYLPLEQGLTGYEIPERFSRQRTLIGRTQGDPGRLVQPVLAALGELFPDLPADRVQSLPAVYATRTRPWSVGTGLFGAAALLALLLAALGLYAVIAFSVRQRELEFGIRRALGAQPSELLRMVLKRGCALTLIGIAAGAIAGLWVGRWVGPLLFEGISPRDPLALAAAALVLVTVALAASFLPARRAARADPRQALQGGVTPAASGRTLGGAPAPEIQGPLHRDRRPARRSLSRGLAARGAATACESAPSRAQREDVEHRALSSVPGGGVRRGVERDGRIAGAAAPYDRYVLRSVGAEVGDGRALEAPPGPEPPDDVAAAGVEGAQHALVGAALEHQVAGGGHHRRVVAARPLHAPDRPARDRIVGLQLVHVIPPGRGLRRASARAEVVALPRTISPSTTRMAPQRFDVEV